MIMESCWEILLLALLIPAGLGYPHLSRPTCSHCPPGTRILHACTPTSDTICTPCDPDTYSDASNDTTRCHQCSKCPENAYISKLCSQKSDTICSPCSTSPQKKSKYYLASCDNQDTVRDTHDVMMGDDAAAVPPESGSNDEHGEVPADSVKEGGDNTHGDEAKEVGNGNKDDIPNTPDDNENTVDDGKEKKDDATNDGKEEVGKSEDAAGDVDKNDDDGNHENKEGETEKVEAENEHNAGEGGEAAKNGADDAVHDTPDETAHDTPDETAHDTPDETAHDTPDDTAHDTPDETAHDTPDETAHDTPDETAHDTPDETAHDTPDETAHDTPDETAHDTPDETAHDTPDETAHDTPDETAHDTPDETAHDTPNETAHDTPDETAHDTPDETAHDTPDETAHDTPDETAHDTPDETAHDTPDETAHDTPDETVHDTPDETAHDTPDDATHDPPVEAALDTPDETVHDTVEGTEDKKADESILDTEDVATDDPGDESDDNTTDKVPNETGNESAGEGGDETAHDTAGGTPDKSTEDTEDEAASHVGGETEVNQGDNATNETEDGEGGDVAALETTDNTDDNEDLHSPRVLEPEHKEFIDHDLEESHGTNDTVDAHDAQKGNATDINPADSISLDETAESAVPSSNEDDEHDAETLGSIHDHTENTTDADVNSVEPEEVTTESPDDSSLLLPSLHAGIEEPHSDDSNKTTVDVADTEEGYDAEPAVGRILSGETANTTQEEEIGSQGENSTSSPQTDNIDDVGVISVDENEKTETGLIDEVTTSEPNVTSESSDVVTGGDAVDGLVGGQDDSEGTTIPPGPEGEITTTATEDNSTTDDSKLGPLDIHGFAKEGSKDTDEAEAEATTEGTTEEGKTTEVEDLDIVMISMKPTKRIPSLEELEALYTDSDTGSGEEVYVTENIFRNETTTVEFSEAGNIPLSGEQKIAKSEEEYEDNNSTAIIVGVTVGGIALFALGFFASRYYKKRRGHFKEMKKVNSNKDEEALEFEPLKSGGNYDDPEIPPTNGIYRPRGKTSPSFPLKNQREEKVDAADLYAVPEKSKRAPLLGVSPPIEELSQSPSAQEPLISGVEKLKYIDDSTDDEYVNTVRTSLLPSRSPASKLSNVVEETPPTSPSITQPYRPNWSTNQSKSGGSSNYTNGSTPKHTHSSVSSQGSLTNDVMNALSNQIQPKTDNRNKGGRVHRKQVASDEDIEC